MFYCYCTCRTLYIIILLTFLITNSIKTVKNIMSKSWFWINLPNFVGNGLMSIEEVLLNVFRVGLDFRYTQLNYSFNQCLSVLLFIHPCLPSHTITWKTILIHPPPRSGPRDFDLGAFARAAHEFYCRREVVVTWTAGTHGKIIKQYVNFCLWPKPIGCRVCAWKYVISITCPLLYTGL